MGGLGHPSPEGHGQLAFQLVLELEIPFLGQKPGHPGSPSPGNNSDLVDGIGMGQKTGHQGVAGLVAAGAVRDGYPVKLLGTGDVTAAYGEDVEDYDRINFFGS